MKFNKFKKQIRSDVPISGPEWEYETAVTGDDLRLALDLALGCIEDLSLSGSTFNRLFRSCCELYELIPMNCTIQCTENFNFNDIARKADDLHMMLTSAASSKYNTRTQCLLSRAREISAELCNVIEGLDTVSGKAACTKADAM